MTTISLRLSDPARLNTTAATGRAIALALWTRFARWAQSTWCVVNGGHYKVLHTAPNRMALRCVACGHSSPGWVVGSPRLARTLAGDAERLRSGGRQAAA